MAWTKKEHRQFERAIVADFRKKLEAIRASGALPDSFEDEEPASVPKMALILMGNDVGLSERAKMEIKNVRHFV